MHLCDVIGAERTTLARQWTETRRYRSERKLAIRLEHYGFFSSVWKYFKANWTFILHTYWMLYYTVCRPIKELTGSCRDRSETHIQSKCWHLTIDCPGHYATTFLGLNTKFLLLLKKLLPVGQGESSVEGHSNNTGPLLCWFDLQNIPQRTLLAPPRAVVSTISVSDMDCENKQTYFWSFGQPQARY